MSNHSARILAYPPGVNTKPIELSLSQDKMLESLREHLTNTLNSLPSDDPRREQLEEKLLNVEVTDEMFEHKVLEVAFTIATEVMSLPQPNNTLIIYPTPQRVEVKFEGGSGLVLPNRELLLS